MARHPLHRLLYMAVAPSSGGLSGFQEFQGWPYPLLTCRTLLVCISLALRASTYDAAPPLPAHM
eukprot:1159550-Pelagomonas_calceolata.AAC.2